MPSSKHHAPPESRPEPCSSRHTCKAIRFTEILAQLEHDRCGDDQTDLLPVGACEQSGNISSLDGSDNANCLTNNFDAAKNAASLRGNKTED